MSAGQKAPIAVVGAGLMGCGIAQSFLAAGHPVALFDPAAASRAGAAGRISGMCRSLSQAGLLDPGVSARVLDRLHLCDRLETAVADAALVIEAVPEILALKQDLFARIEAACPPDALLATNTSSLAVDDIGADLADSGRLLVMHWFNPAHLVPVVEVAPSRRTAGRSLDAAVDLLTAIGKTPIRLNRAEPGFIVNRMQLALLREAFDLLDRGVASGVDIDRAITGSLGLRWAAMGPLRSVDVINPDVILNVAANLFPRISAATDTPDGIAARLRDPAQDLARPAGRSEAPPEDRRTAGDAAEIAARDRAMMAILACAGRAPLRTGEP